MKFAKTHLKEVLNLIESLDYPDSAKDCIWYNYMGKIERLDHFNKAVEANNGKYHVFIEEHGKEIVLDKAKTAERNSLILNKYKVPSDRSEDLKQL